MNIWELPTSAAIGGVEYPIHADFRDILNIFRYLDDPDRPEYLRWRIAIALFYDGEIPDENVQEAMEYLAEFISCGNQDAKPGPKLLDWEQDAQVIVADVNKTAGAEIRSLPFLHWWTFVAYFNAIGEGQLAQGAVIPPNREFMAVLGDQKHGTNIEAPLETIQEAVALVMDDFISSNMSGQEAVVAVLRDILQAVLGIQIGDDVIGEAVTRYQQKMAVVKGY